jgi:hypothetical protein
MAAKKGNPAMEFLVESLKNDRNAVYRDVAEAAVKKKLKVYPIMWGRAKALLGYVKVAPRGQGKMAKARAEKAAGAAPKRGPGRPPKAASAVAFDGTLESIVNAVKGSEQAKARYRAALEKIQTILADALA